MQVSIPRAEFSLREAQRELRQERGRANAANASDRGDELAVGGASRLIHPVDLVAHGLERRLQFLDSQRKGDHVECAGPNKRTYKSERRCIDRGDQRRFDVSRKLLEALDRCEIVRVDLNDSRGKSGKFAGVDPV